MKRPFPLHGILGILLLFLSEFLFFRKIDPFYSWFYCFAWWSYVLAIDGIVYRLKGNSLIGSRPGEFFLMIPWSIFIWLIFEAANLSLRNWYYIDLPDSTVERWAGYAIAYGTVLPGIFETTELLEALGLFSKARVKNIKLPESGQAPLVFLGVLCLFSSVYIPNYFFPLIWVGFIFLLEPFNHHFGGQSLLRDVENGNPRKIYLLLCAGLICGLLWEFWNFWALSKWVYTVPFFDRRKGFEMPFLGFLGFPPFAIQVYVMYNFISLFRFQRGWEEPSYRLHRDSKTRPLTSVLAGILIVTFSILIFRAIDSNPAGSFYPRLDDAYWIETPYRKELPKVGINTLDDLLRRTSERKEKDELALRLLVPKEDLIRWVERAKLARLKGVGIQNLRLLEITGVDSVAALAAETPDRLYEKMKTLHKRKDLPRKAQIRIWIKAAKQEVES
jgi:hypothetical protein